MRGLLVVLSTVACTAVPAADDATRPPDGGVPGTTASSGGSVDAGAYRPPIDLLAVGGTFGCIVSELERVFCWGGSPAGQVGSGFISVTPLPPTEVVGLGDVVHFAAGPGHSCAADQDGGVQCWGDNGARQLGTRAGDPRAVSATPIKVEMLPPVREIGAGNSFTCAHVEGTDLRCWGFHVPILNPGAPNQVTRFDGPTRISIVAPDGLVIDRLAMGGSHGCMLMSDGTVYCWGENQSGQLGRGDREPQQSALRVPGLSGVLQVEAGQEHTCALMEDRTLRCWGWGLHGQLGTGRLDDELVPTDVPGVAGVVEVQACNAHTCARDDQGRVLCWGANWSAQLGADASTEPGLTPGYMVGIPSATQLSCSMDHTCVLTEIGDVYCWGDNQGGQLGDGTEEPRASPVKVQW